MDRDLKHALPAWVWFGGLGLVFVILYAPILSALVFSLSADRFPSLDISGLSTRWYGDVLADPRNGAALSNSLVIALATALIATTLGFAAAYADFRFRFFGQRAILALALLPPTVPVVVLSLAMLAYFSRAGISGSVAAIIFGHVVLATPFAMAICRLRLEQMPSELEIAAQNLGAGPARALGLIVLPHVAPALVAALLITFAVSLDEYAIAWFVGGLEQTVPVVVLNTLQGQVNPTIHVIGTLTFTVTLTLVFAAQALLLRKASPTKQNKVST
ncbi:MAG: ABC transporter permease [Devosia sp.]|uniref:ABC transporter permease n=1 Tax=Devosia sp. TaxID=1871048 RepID=UPI0024CB0E1D|nr:ABC transporter permease [Devosia sp.]UYO00198.1 MAG: ABC transporter permease [Devosia sp.]